MKARCHVNNQGAFSMHQFRRLRVKPQKFLAKFSKLWNGETLE